MRTDNSYFADKVALRARHLPDKNMVSVLDCYAGTGRIWKAVRRRRPDVAIDVLPIEKELGKHDGFHLPGGNIDWINSLDLNSFDVVDLDAYGVACDQLKALFDLRYKGIVFVTMTTAMRGELPKALLLDLGYSDKMIDSAPGILARNGWESFKSWLAQKGVGEIVHRSTGRKHYLMFNGADARAVD